MWRLPRRAGPDVERAHLPRQQQVPDGAGDDLGAIVAAQVARSGP